MATVTVSTSALLTAEQFASRPDPGYPEELVRGMIVPMSPPSRRHGQICNRVGRILGNFAEEHDLGHVLNNDSGIITERDPDSMRGPDVAFYSYKLIPKGPVPDDYGPEIPELVVEVRWKNDRWPNVLAKVSEYLQAGVLAVLILDDDADKAILCLPDQAPQTLSLDDELRLPNILPDFAVTIRKFFE